ncbi:hypothetical protein JNW90_12995 [Micromonospora sp. STR1s_5]|nr:hypothetical protein [Micromonospora sp. STR1s_5]
MSNYLHPNMSEVAAGQARPPKRRRARWLVAGVAGLTGVVGLAAFTSAGVSGAAGKSGNPSNAGTQVLGRLHAAVCATRLVQAEFVGAAVERVDLGRVRRVAC